MRMNSKHWLSLLPVVSVLLLLMGGTLLYAIIQSLGYAPVYGVNEFPTLKYYSELWRSDGFYTSLLLTIYYAVTATVLALVFAIILALILIKSFRFKRWINYLYKFPLMVPYLVGIALVIVLFGNGGIIARSFQYFGLIEVPGDFPAILYTHYGWGVIMVYVWKQMPFMTLSISAVLIRIGPETDEAARMLGASKWQRIWYVIIPQIIPGILSATLICFAFNFGSFEAPFILGGGFPDTLPVTAWRLFNDADYSNRLEGMAVIVTIAVLLSVILLANSYIYKKYKET